MAAFTGTPASTKQYFDQLNRVPESFSLANLRGKTVNYVHALGAGTGAVNLYKLPAGQIRLLTNLCNFTASQFAANAVLSLGYREYVDAAGDTQAEDDNAFLSALDVAAGAITKTYLALPAAGFIDFNSASGVVIFATIGTGNIEDGDTLQTKLYWV